MNDRPSPSPADPAPWYRQRWPWFLIAGPAIVVVAGIATAVIAHRSDDGVVAEDYYKRGLLVNRQIAAMPPASAPVATTVSFDATGTLRVVPQGDDDEDESIAVTLSHPASGARETLTLTRAGDGTFTGHVSSTQGGRWIVTYAPRHGQWPTTLVQRGGPAAAN